MQSSARSSPKSSKKLETIEHADPNKEEDVKEEDIDDIKNVSVDLITIRQEMANSYDNLKIQKLTSLQRSINTSETAKAKKNDSSKRSSMIREKIDVSQSQETMQYKSKDNI